MIKLSGYYRCDNYDICGFKTKWTRHLIYFKGNHLCHRCKLNRSNCLVYIPISKTSEDILKSSKKKGYLKVTKVLKDWARINSRTPRIQDNGHRVIGTSLTHGEIKILSNHFYKMGYNYREINFQIEKIKGNIKKAHQEYKSNLRDTKPNFQEEFTKLVQVSK